MERFIWEAWVGQKVAQCYTEGDITTIILEDGRGITFDARSIGFYHFSEAQDPTRIFPVECAA